MSGRVWRRVSVPPVPALIPIAAVRPQRRRHSDNNNEPAAECEPCALDEQQEQQLAAAAAWSGEAEDDSADGDGDREVVLQRSRRRARQAAADADAEPIDAAAASRDWSGPQAPARRARPERHRKSDRRRHKSDRLLRKRSSTATVRHRDRSPPPPPPASPRVNPIFVWVRQEDTRIVDVKCEDYDKRNRILLTKTAHGWRAIPRTETLSASALEEASASKPASRKPRGRRSGRAKRWRPGAPPEPEPPPADVESHLPSHTIPVPPQRRAPDSSPLDNLLAVAELEFKQHHAAADLHPGAAAKSPLQDDCDYTEDDENHMAMTDILDRLEQSLQSPMQDNDLEQDPEPDQDVELDHNQEAAETDVIDDDDTDDCNMYLPEEEQQNPADSTEELQLLEQSENNQSEAEQDDSKPEDMEEEQLMPSEHEYDTQMGESNEMEQEEEQEQENEQVEEQEQEQEQEQSTEQTDESEQPTDLSIKSTKLIQIEKSSAVSEEDYDDEPTDLSTKSKSEQTTEASEVRIEAVEEDMQPTDLSIRKTCLAIDPPRPASQNSETIQSPQPSGIPAVPPSPDIYPGNKLPSGPLSGKSLFLESLLSSASPKLALTSEVTITRNQKEPLDLGKSRKSASPTVSCSEEAKDEPATKRVKIEDITLKNLLHVEKQKAAVKTAETTIRAEILAQQDKQSSANVETSRLLELLTADSDIDPLTQLKQLLADTEVTVPDPLLVPKDRLSSILSSPAREIPRLLSQRPELRLPEALAYPQLLQDPDILVITLAQLQTILHKQNQPITIDETVKPNNNNNNIKEKEVKPPAPVEKPSPKPQKPPERERDRDRERERFSSQPQQQSNAQPSTPKAPNGLASEIDAATTAAFNQMLWLPYLNHLEAAALACGNNADFLKALNSVCTPPGSYPGSGLPDAVPAPMFPGGRFPGLPTTGFPPMQPPLDYANSLELAMWQEAMMQANLQQQQQQQQQRSNNMKQQYRDSMSYNNQKKYHSSTTNQRVHSSARTSPITHTFHQQRIPTNGLQAHPYGYPLPGMRHNLQIPQYNPSSLTHQQQALLQQHHHQQLQQQQQQHQAAAAAAAVKRSSSASSSSSTSSSASYRKSSSDILKQFQTNAYNKYAYSKLHPQGIQTQNKDSKSPRVTCKSLQNLLSPKKMDESPLKTTSTTTKPAQPMDLSGARPQMFSKLKVKQNLMDPVVASFGAKLWRHEDVPEVGSTTEEMSTHHLHETQTHLWHPLFGK